MRRYLLFFLLLLMGCGLPGGRKQDNIIRIQSNGIELAVARQGQGPDTLLLLHHGNGNLMMWQGIAPYLENEFHLIMVDQRGHGHSDKPAWGNHIDTMATDILGVMDALGVKSAHVLGASLGAEVALSLAARHPERVKSLVLEGGLCSAYGPFSPGTLPESEYEADAARQVAKWQAVQVRVWENETAMVESLKTDYGVHWNPVVETYIRYGGHQMDDGRYTEGWIKAARNGYFSHYFSYRFEDYHRQITCPVLMLPAETEWQDAPTRQAIEKMAALSANARIEAVPGLMHAYGWMLIPEELGPLVNSYLKTVN